MDQSIPFSIKNMASVTYLGFLWQHVEGCVSGSWVRLITTAECITQDSGWALNWKCHKPWKLVRILKLKLENRNNVKIMTFISTVQKCCCYTILNFCMSHHHGVMFLHELVCRFYTLLVWYVVWILYFWTSKIWNILCTSPFWQKESILNIC